MTARGDWSGNRVLVTDGDERAALAVVRSLGRAGYEVVVGSATGRSLAGASRHASADIALPDSLSAVRRFAAKTCDTVERLAVSAVLPVTDASMVALLESGRLSPRVTAPLPSLEALREASDKVRLVELARRCGISTPRSTVVGGPVDVARVDLGDVGPPYVIKPARSVAGGPDNRIRTRVRYAADENDVRTALDSLSSQAFPVLVQEHVSGAGHGIFLLRWEGETLAQFAHRRIREKPPSGGVSVYRESVRADPRLIAASEMLLDACGWEGVAMVEYCSSGPNGVPYLMEVNGRFWGSLQLAVDAGVDFPALLMAAAQGQVAEPVREYRTGVRSRWWWGEVDHLVARFREGGSDLGDGRPSRLRTLADVLAPWHPGSRREVFRWDDPRPFLRETRLWLRDALKGADD